MKTETIVTTRVQKARRARIVCLSSRRRELEGLRLLLASDGLAAEVVEPTSVDAAICAHEADLIVIDAGGAATSRRDAAIEVADAAGAGGAARPVVSLCSPAAPARVKKRLAALGEVAFTPLSAPAGVAARIKSALRLRNLRDEARLRSESFGGEADMAGAPSLPSAPRAISGRTEDEAAAPMSILAIGAPSRHFLAARAALEARSVNVVAAVSAGTAFDFLERDPFDAALAFIDDEAAQTLNICAVMRRNPRLYDTPVLAVAGPDCCEDFNQMYTRGVSDIVETPINAEDFADRALAHAQRFRRIVGLRRFLQDTRPARTLDAESGLFNSSFFGRHFSRLTTHAQKTGRPLSLAAFRLRDFNEVVAADGTEAAEMLLRQASETARLLVRAEDFAARLGQDTFLIAMPSTSTEDGGVAVRRICGMLAHTRFKRRLNDRGGTISLNYGLVEHNADDPIERTVATALATLKANAA